MPWYRYDASFGGPGGEANGFFYVQPYLLTPNKWEKNREKIEKEVTEEEADRLVYSRREPRYGDRVKITKIKSPPRKWLREKAEEYRRSMFWYMTECARLYRMANR